jgi:hypothetical protein
MEPIMEEQEKPGSFLRLISGAETLTLDECEDSLISDATEIFDGWIDSDFEKWGLNTGG